MRIDLRRSNSNGFWDKTGAVASWACAVHCMLMPFIISFLPLIGLSCLAYEGFEYVFIGLSFCLAAFTLLPGYFKQHGKIRTLFLFVGGIGLVFFADILFPENLFGKLIFVVSGAVLITGSHVLNRRLCKACHSCENEN